MNEGAMNGLISAIISNITVDELKATLVSAKYLGMLVRTLVLKSDEILRNECYCNNTHSATFVWLNS